MELAAIWNDVPKQACERQVVPANEQSPYMNRELLYQKYVVEGKSARTIAQEIGCSSAAVDKWMGRLGIQHRHVGSHERPINAYNNDTWLRNAYVVQQRTICNIAKEVGVADDAVASWLRQHNIPIRSRDDRLALRAGTYWQDADWLVSAYEMCGRNTKMLARQIGISAPTLVKYLLKCDISPRTRSECVDSCDRFSLQFFEHWSPQLSWLLGYAFADGNIHNNTLTFASVDYDLLAKAAKCMSCNEAHIHRHAVENNGHGEIFMLRVCHHKLPAILASYNLVPRKSLIAKMPDCIPDELVGAFVRGVFDGDGCACATKMKSGITGLQMHITTGSRVFAEQLRDRVESLCGASGTVMSRSGNVYRFYVTGVIHMLRFARFMYQGSNGLYLDRKRAIVDRFVDDMGKLAPLHPPRFAKGTWDVASKIASEWSTIDTPKQPEQLAA